MLEAILVVAVLAADQITKYLTDIYLSPLGTSYALWGGVFHFTSVHNTGMAFGMLAGARWLFVVATLLAVAAILWLLVKKHRMLHTLVRVALALVLSGALGNFIDRMLLGYVRDMLDFRLINFAIFNVADSAVCIGMGLLILDLLFLPKGKALLRALDQEDAPRAATEQAAQPQEQTQSAEPDAENEIERKD